MRKNFLCPAVFAINQFSVRHSTRFFHTCLLLQYRSALGLKTDKEVQDSLSYAVTLELIMQQHEINQETTLL
jgi:hypothetical protein